MADRLILCSECGTRNRVGSDKGATPICGNCGKTLTISGYKGTGFSQFARSAIWFALGAVSLAGILQYNNPNFIKVSGVLGWFNSQKIVDQTTPPDGFILDNQSTNKEQSDAQNLDFSNEAEEVDEFDDQVSPKLTPVAISTGVVKRAKKAVAPLKIITAEGYNYFVKLVDMNNQTVMTMYIVGGEPFETKAPLGAFKIRYVAGHIWYGEEDRRFFGKPPNTIGSKADELFEFSVQQSETETIYSGHTIELILQTNGNLRVTPISVKDF